MLIFLSLQYKVANPQSPVAHPFFLFLPLAHAQNLLWIELAENISFWKAFQSAKMKTGRKGATFTRAVLGLFLVRVPPFSWSLGLAVVKA